MDEQNIPINMPMTSNQAKDTRRFVNWFVKTFKETRSEGRVTWEDIFYLYKGIFPSSVLTVEDVEKILEHIGYISPRNPDPMLIPDIHYIQLTEDFFLIDMLLTQEWEPDILKSLRRIKFDSLRTKLDIEEISGYRINHFDAFYNLWCIDSRKIKNSNKVKMSDRRAVATNVKQAYTYFCTVNGQQQRLWEDLRDYLKSKGHVHGKGYAQGKAGVTYFAHLFVPVGGEGAEGLGQAALTNLFVKEINGEIYTPWGDSIGDMDYIESGFTQEEYIEELKGLANRRCAELHVEV